MKKIILIITITISLFYLLGCSNEVTTADLPNIVLNGEEEVTILVNQEFVDLGATVVGDFSLYITVDSNLINTIPGSYSVVYSITYEEEIYSVTRTVIVFDPSDREPPVITLIGSPILFVDYKQNYIELGAQFSDNEDTEGTVIVGGQVVNTNVLGTYLVMYNAFDSSGNSAVQLTRTVIVEDVTPPIITLNGLEEVHLEYNSSYIEMDAEYSDNHDSYGTIIVGGDEVDTLTIGTYIVTYNAIDSSFNAAVEVERTIIVEDTTAPVLTLVGEHSISVEYGGIYLEDGATFLDNYDETGEVIIGGDEVDTFVPGTYIVTYNAVDSFSNPAEQITRTIIVEENTNPN